MARTGDVRADIPLRRSTRDVCSVEDCGRGAHSNGLCQSHGHRMRRYGDPTAGGPLRVVTGAGSVNRGYLWVSVPRRLRYLVGGRHAAFEHRLVLAQQLRRPLASDEVVHHRNGDRLDNRLDNLELWSTAQPRGQRGCDKVASAFDMLRWYDPDAVGAPGLDLDPEIGSPICDAALSNSEPTV